MAWNYDISWKKAMEPNNKSTPGQGANQSLQETHSSDSQKLVHQHLQDEHHQITDEDLRNVKISTDVDAKLDDMPDNTGNTDENPDTDLDNRFVTPWDVTT